MFEICSMSVRSGRDAMDKALDDILKTLPDKPARSRLTAYADLIDELRQRGWTYRGVVGVLAEQCGVKVSVSNLHHFVMRRATAERTTVGELTVGNELPGKSRSTASPIASPDRRADNDSEFTFDSTVPLRLKQHWDKAGQ
jgi:hypothetical protein